MPQSFFLNKMYKYAQHTLENSIIISLNLLKEKIHHINLFKEYSVA